MKRRTLLQNAAIATTTALVAKSTRADTLAIPPHSDVDDVKALLDASAKEWSNGDIDAFCAHYHDDAVFVSPSGLTKGRRAVLERYKKRYAGKEQMGALSFEILDVIASKEAASVAMKWKLAFAASTSKPPAEGFSVIGLVKPSSTSPWLIKHDASM